MEPKTFKCELCGKERTTRIEFEGLTICFFCKAEITPPKPYRIVRRHSIGIPNVHLNGMQAAMPRPFGQLP